MYKMYLQDTLWIKKKAGKQNLRNLGHAQVFKLFNSHKVECLLILQVYIFLSLLFNIQIIFFIIK